MFHLLLSRYSISLSKKLINILKFFCKASSKTLIGLCIQRMNNGFIPRARWEITWVVTGGNSQRQESHRSLDFHWEHFIWGPSCEEVNKSKGVADGLHTPDTNLNLTVTLWPNLNGSPNLNPTPNPNQTLTRNSNTNSKRNLCRTIIPYTNPNQNLETNNNHNTKQDQNPKPNLITLWNLTLVEPFPQS